MTRLGTRYIKKLSALGLTLRRKCQPSSPDLNPVRQTSLWKVGLTDDEPPSMSVSSRQLRTLSSTELPILPPLPSTTAISFVTPLGQPRSDCSTRTVQRTLWKSPLMDDSCSRLISTIRSNDNNNNHRKTEIRKHADNCLAPGIHFQPLVVETFGGWDTAAVKLLKAVATQCAPRKSLAPAMEIKQFFQRLSIAL